MYSNVLLSLWYILVFWDYGELEIGLAVEQSSTDMNIYPRVFLVYAKPQIQAIPNPEPMKPLGSFANSLMYRGIWLPSNTDEDILRYFGDEL